VPDQFKIKFVNPGIFVSKSSGLSLANTYNDSPKAVEELDEAL
jgi:hypothetical protein